MSALVHCAVKLSLALLFLVLFGGAEMNGQEVEEQFVSTRPPQLQDAGGGEPHAEPTIPGDGARPDSTAAPQPAKTPSSETRERFTCTCRRNACACCALRLILCDYQVVEEI